MNELQLKRWVRAEWKGWSEAYEPRRGGGSGIADLQLAWQGQDGRGSSLVPVELKLGHTGAGRFFPAEVRPVQVGWHVGLNAAGVRTFFLAGVGPYRNGPARLFIFGGWMAMNWRDGYWIGQECWELDKRNLTSELERAFAGLGYWF